VFLSSIVSSRKSSEKAALAQETNEVGACYSAAVGEGALLDLWTCYLGSIGKEEIGACNGKEESATESPSTVTPSQDALRTTNMSQDDE
jgi:hypothetical protein